jgi:hypothetical protein
MAMNRIILSDTDANKLGHLHHPVELCDPAGRVLGRLLPAIDLSEWEPVSPEAGEEELDRRERAGEKRYATIEVLARLENL